MLIIESLPDDQTVGVKGEMATTNMQKALQRLFEEDETQKQVLLFKEFFSKRHWGVGVGGADKHIPSFLNILDKLAISSQELNDQLKMGLFLNSLPKSCVTLVPTFNAKEIIM